MEESAQELPPRHIPKRNAVDDEFKHSLLFAGQAQLIIRWSSTAYYSLEVVHHIIQHRKLLVINSIVWGGVRIKIPD